MEDRFRPTSLAALAADSRTTPENLAALELLLQTLDQKRYQATESLHPAGIPHLHLSGSLDHLEKHHQLEKKHQLGMADLQLATHLHLLRTSLDQEADNPTEAALHATQLSLHLRR